MEVIKDIENIEKELEHLIGDLSNLIKRLKNIEGQYKNVKKQDYSSTYTYLSTALIFGSIVGGPVGGPVTAGLSVAVGVFGHILTEYYNPTEFIIQQFGILEVVEKLEDLKRYCQNAKAFYDSLCQHLSNNNDKNVYLLGAALNELEVRFNGYFLHFSKIRMEENRRQVVEEVLHGLDCNIKEVIAFQQKVSNVQGYLNQMKSYQGYNLI